MDVMSYIYQSPFLCLCGLREGVFPGVFLLSLCLLSGFPVDFAILFGPFLIPMVVMNIRVNCLTIIFFKFIESNLTDYRINTHKKHK
jgi:hypothetical protein